MLLTVFLASAFAADPVCPSGETLIFGCALKNSSTLAVCATPELSPTQGSLQVHLTSKSDTLVYPSGPVASPFKYDRYTRPQTTMLALDFELDGVRYRVGDDEVEGEQWRGLTVIKGGEEEMIDCKKSSVKGSLFKLEGRMPEPSE